MSKALDDCIVDVAKANPRELSGPEVMDIMTNWAHRSSADVCTARYNEFVQLLIAWGRMSAQERAEKGAVMANAAFVSGDCATVLSRG